MTDRTFMPPGSGSLASELLQSVLDTARAAFGVQACSVLLLDELVRYGCPVKGR